MMMGNGWYVLYVYRLKEYKRLQDLQWKTEQDVFINRHLKLKPVHFTYLWNMQHLGTPSTYLPQTFIRVGLLEYITNDY